MKAYWESRDLYKKYYQDSPESRINRFIHPFKANLKRNLGTIVSNWLSIIKFIDKYNIIGLHGHLHQEFEILIKNKLNDKKKKAFEFFWASNPQQNSISNIINIPKDLQTPSLGYANQENLTKTGGFRRITIENNAITSYRVYYLSELLISKIKTDSIKISEDKITKPLNLEEKMQNSSEIQTTFALIDN